MEKTEDLTSHAGNTEQSGDNPECGVLVAFVNVAVLLRVPEA